MLRIPLLNMLHRMTSDYIILSMHGLALRSSRCLVQDKEADTHGQIETQTHRHAETQTEGRQTDSHRGKQAYR